MSEIKVNKRNCGYLRPASLEDVASNLSKAAFELNDDIEIKIGSFRKTKKELLQTLEDQVSYQEIYEQWFPEEEITPQNLAGAPRRIVREFVLASVVDFAVELSEEESSKRSVGTGIKNYFRNMLLEYKIDSLELQAYLERMEVSPTFIESFVKWIYL